ncbi:MFS transporter [Streptomyces sp. CB02923]|uniref:MFS transporter n=1 Tax=Streptomyces sp. CB02923 TaxID=1718985 RepID=UPI00093BFFF1|nr:MFS transporter [Streptomyces sp. CB02923]OKI00630.1 MFS transporter [Streptomyces sp. CB02923]
MPAHQPRSRPTGKSPNGTATLVTLIVAVLSYALMQTMLVPSIGVLQRELNTTPVGASWAVLSSTLLASAVLTPLISRLGDSHGKRRVLTAVLLVYLVGTIGCAASWNIGALIGFRAVQGVALSILPLSFGLLREALPPRRMAFGLGLTSGLVAGAAGVGLLAGGLIVDHTSWRWLFVAGGVLIVATLLLTLRTVPESPDTSRAPLDLPGAGLLGLSLVTALLGLTEGPGRGWGSAAVLGLFAACVVLFVLFVLHERSCAHPLVDIGLLARRPILMTHLGAFMLGANQFVFYVLVPKLAELPNGLPPDAARLVTYGFGASVTGAGLMMLPGTLLGLPASAIAGRVGRRCGARTPLVLGLVVSAAGSALMAFLHAAVWQVVVFYAVVAVGAGFAMAALPKLVHNITAPAQNATANGINTVARTVGGAVGSQLGTAVLTTWAIDGTSLPSANGFTIAFAAGAVVAALGVLPALWTHTRSTPPTTAPGTAHPPPWSRPEPHRPAAHVRPLD